jgi:MinD-like ATPase involved in chromosome partitioning or flagellar assembly
MAMQVNPTFAHIPPGPEGIVAQDEVHAIDTHLGICLDTFPAIAALDRGIVIVAGDKVFATMQRLD